MGVLLGCAEGDVVGEVEGELEGERLGSALGDALGTGHRKLTSTLHLLPATGLHRYTRSWPSSGKEE